MINGYIRLTSINSLCRVTRFDSTRTVELQLQVNSVVGYTDEVAARLLWADNKLLANLLSYDCTAVQMAAVFNALKSARINYMDACSPCFVLVKKTAARVCARNVVTTFREGSADKSKMALKSCTLNALPYRMQLLTCMQVTIIIAINAAKL